MFSVTHLYEGEAVSKRVRRTMSVDELIISTITIQAHDPKQAKICNSMEFKHFLDVESRFSYFFPLFSKDNV